MAFQESDKITAVIKTGDGKELVWNGIVLEHKGGGKHTVYVNGHVMVLDESSLTPRAENAT